MKIKHIVYTGAIADYYRGELRLLLMIHKYGIMNVRVEGKDNTCDRPVIIIDLEAQTAYIQYVSEHISEYDFEDNIFTCDIQEVKEILMNKKTNNDSPYL